MIQHEETDLKEGQKEELDLEVRHFRPSNILLQIQSINIDVYIFTEVSLVHMLKQSLVTIHTEDPSPSYSEWLL